MLMKNIMYCLRSSVLMIFLYALSGCVGSETHFSAAHVSFDEQTVPVAILGGGVAGLTAALYCSQANIPCVVIEGHKPGGALSQSHSVRNWPGVAQAPGHDIVDSMRKQVAAGGVPIKQEMVIGVDLKQWPRAIQVADCADGAKTRTLKALTVIVAMGTEPNLLGIPGETGANGYWGRGVSNCAVCEGALYKDKVVAIVGGGDAAITEADYLADIARKVIILVRKDVFRAKDLKSKDKALSRSNVEVIFNAEVKEVIGDGKTVTHIVIHDNKNNTDDRMALDGLFLAIGSRSNTALFKNHLQLDERGFVVLKNRQESSVKGVYAAGDVADYEFVQAVTAASDGCKSALQAIKFLKDCGFESSMLKSSRPLPAHEAETQDHGLVHEIKSAQDFQRLVLEAKKPVVIDIFTTWCIPCQKMMPIVQNLAAALKNRVTFVKINASSQDIDIDVITRKLQGQQLQSVPTFVFVKQGKEIGRMIGARDEAVFEKAIKQAFTME